MKQAENMEMCTVETNPFQRDLLVAPIPEKKNGTVMLSPKHLHQYFIAYM